MDEAVESGPGGGAPPCRRGPLWSAACASMLIFGSVMALLGALLPELAPRLGFGLAQAGRLFLVMNSAMLVASLAAGPVIDRSGFRLPMALGPLLAAAAMAFMSAAGSYGHLIPAMLLLGLGGGALNTASNTLTADLHPEQRRKNAALNLLGVFFGLGALLVPLLVGALVNSAGVAPLLAGAAAACLALAAVSALLRYPHPKAGGAMPRAGFGNLIRNPLVIVLGLLLMLQSGNEFLLGGFISTFLVSAAGMSVSAASFSLTSFWAAMLIARLLWGRLLLFVDGRTLICACAAASAAAGLLLACAPSRGLAVAAVPLLGFAASGIFPTALGLAGARFADQSGSVIGLLLAMALIGGMTVPWLAGQAGEAWGVRATIAFAPAGFLLILILAVIAGRQTRSGR